MRPFSPLGVLLDAERDLLAPPPPVTAWQRRPGAGFANERAPGLTEQGFPVPKANALVKLLHASPGALEQTELLHLLLVLPGADPQRMGDVADRLIARFGSLGGVLAAPRDTLAAVATLPASSIDLLKAVQHTMEAVLREAVRERTLIGGWNQLVEYLKVSLRHALKEEARALYLDRKNQLLHEAVLGRGTVDHTPLYPREVVQTSLERGASAVILVHNHPSGDPTPSQGDITMTRAVKAALATLEIELHDHVIVGGGKFVSMRSSGLC